MTYIIQATGDGACLLNAVAIGLAIEILSGRLDSQKDQPGYRRLLETFSSHHPQFQPRDWSTLKRWLAYYNAPRDLELLFAPVLFKLNLSYQAHLDESILNELTNLVWKNKTNIQNGLPWYQFSVTGEYEDTLFPKLDGLDLQHKSTLIISLKKIIHEIDTTQRNRTKTYLQKHAPTLLQDLKIKVNHDPQAYQRGFSCAELNPMMNSLGIGLQENDYLPVQQQLVAVIRLRNQEAHWDLVSNAGDVKLLNNLPHRLKMSSREAFERSKSIHAPQGLELPKQTRANSPQKTPVSIQTQFTEDNLNDERIMDLINNRSLFSTIEEWQLVHADLFTSIVKRLNNTHFTTEQWSTITAAQLCHLVGIPYQANRQNGNSSVNNKRTDSEPTLNHHAEQLIEIIATLNKNLLNQSNGRKTSRNNHWKVLLLTEISTKIQQDHTSMDNIDQFIADIRAVCAMKRNKLHFWATPHSVNEFEHLLKEELKTVQTINSAAHLP